MLIYIDMDDVICDYSSSIIEKKKSTPDVLHPQGIENFFSDLPPISYAIQSVNYLRKKHEVYILTAPSILNPLSYTEKRIWIEKYFGLDFVNRLIISSNKGLLKGDILIDDHIEGRGQENFEGELIQFGRGDFKNWQDVLKYLEHKKWHQESSMLKLYTAVDLQSDLRAYITAQRKKGKLSVQALADRTCIPSSTIRRFEKTGDISLRQFLVLYEALDDVSRFKPLLIPEEPMPRSIEDVLRRNR